MTRIIAIGDSTTAGTPGFRSPLESPPDGDGNVESQFAYWLMRARADWRVLNRGVNGERSDQIAARFARDVTTEKPHAVIVLAGVNDIYQGRAAGAVERELEAMYLASRTDGIPVVAASILPYNTASPDENRRMHEVNRWIAAYALAHEDDVAYCDARAAVAAPESLDRLASSPDGLHPSVDGYRAIAEALEPVLDRLLRRSIKVR
jgi:lysophospholipase L1-like esterase